MANEVLTKLPGGMLRYTYALDDDAGAVRESHALAELAAPYRERFREEIAELNWIVEYGRKLPDSPYKADFMLCTADAAI